MKEKKSYYDLILKQKHAYIKQFQAFFSTTNLPKKNCVVYFLPSEYEKQKNFPMLFYYNFFETLLKDFLCHYPKIIKLKTIKKNSREQKESCVN